MCLIKDLRCEMNPTENSDMPQKGLKSSLTEPDPEMQMRATKMHGVMSQPCFPDVNVSVGSCSGCKTTVNRFDVFINHRGPDTKHTMAYHLYDLFRDRGIKVFLDKEEFQGGDSLPEEIQKTIDCCKVHVCIFSSGYAESVWCLRELVMILNKYETGRSLLIPIFYDVEPSDVRHLQGSFGEGFQKHSFRASTEVTDQWRNALSKVSYIVGYEGKGELCMTIVNRICEKLNVGLVATPGKIVGIHDKVIQIKNDILRYRNEGRSVTLVEVSGIGGIGKTTFAKCLYNHIYTQFERHYFMEDISGTIDKNGVNAVHKQLANNLLRDDSILCGSQLKQLLKERLQNADILLVLDNINRENCLNVVFMDDYVNLAGTSVIIMTSREKDVVKHNPEAARYSFISLQISELKVLESKEIFCYYAFGGIHQVFNTQFDNLINKIISKCGGIPLALVLMGRQLKGREIAFWEKFWIAIKDSLPSDLKKILKLSYDSLETELEKCLFLDVAIFFHLESVDLLKKCKGKNDEDEAEISIALDNLQKRHLIDVRSGNLYMHDLLVNLGKMIVKDESSEPGHRSRLWNPVHVREVLSDNTGTAKVKGLSLVWKGEAVLDEDLNGEPCPWSADAFAEMSSLEILILNGDCIEGDFSKISKRLLLLKWTQFPLESIPATLCLNRLRVLLLSHGRNTRLWDFSERAPLNLRQLMVRECKMLQKLPEFTARFRHLSSIRFDGLVSLECIPDSFGLLKGIKYLCLNNCMALKELPESIGNLKHLRELMIHHSGLTLLPTSIGMLVQLELLTLVNCPALEELPQTLGDLHNLRGFVIRECYNMETSKQITPYNLPRLRSLTVTNMRNLRKFSQLFASLSSLEHLYLRDCQSLQEFPESLENLSHLEYLYIDGCVNLTSLPATIGNLKKLRMFCIENCLALKGFPSTLGNLSALKWLAMYNCGRVDVIHTHAMFKLERLTLFNCGNLRCIDGTDGCLQSLKCVITKGCPRLSFPDSLVCQPPHTVEEFIPRYSYDDSENASENYMVWHRHHYSVDVEVDLLAQAKVSPWLFPRLKERMRHIVAAAGTDNPSMGVYLFSANHHEQLVLPKGHYKCIICFISAVYLEDFSDNIFPPTFTFDSHLVGDNIVKDLAQFHQFNIGEQLNLGISFFSTSGEGSHVSFKITTYMELGAEVRGGIVDDCPVYKAVVKEGWVICLQKPSDVASDINSEVTASLSRELSSLLVRELNGAFYCGLQYQHLLSFTGSQLPSGLSFQFLSTLPC